LPTRDEVARQVAERFKLVRERDSWYFDCPVFEKYKVRDALIDALIDSELRHEADQVRIQELREALREIIRVNIDGRYTAKMRQSLSVQTAEALLSGEKK